MNFVRSRVALVGLVVAWPLAQLVACTAEDRSYDPVTGEGGDGAMGGSSVGGANAGKGGSKGGSSGKAGGSSGSSAGGDSGGGGDATGGTDASGGTGGNSAGKGGSSSGGKGGSSGTDAGSGGSDAGSGGSSATGTGGTVDPGCVATGDEICNDGADNDCDGTTDCLVLTSQFPLPNGAAAGTDVAYTFEAPATGATFQCRVTHGDTPSGSFKACAGGVVDSTVSPFDMTMASDPLNDGFWTTEVRLRFSGGATSDVFRRGVYIHSSLVGQTRCDALASTAAWVAAAEPHLPDAGAIVAAGVKNPFVQIPFEPPINARHQVAADDGLVKWQSLRRQFDFSPNKHYLVMTRTYSSRAAAGMGCYAANKRIHHLRGTSLASGPMTYQNCQAVVFNKAGAGYCLDYLGGAIVSVDFDRAPTRATWVPAGTPPAGAYTYPANALDADYAPDADNLLWRKLTARIRPVNGGYVSNFSSKCDVDGCATADTLYLPDKQYFSYWE